MEKNLVYVGTYSEPKPSRRGEGIYVLRQDPSTGALERVHVVEGVVNSSFLCFDPSYTYLFSVNETQEYQGRETGAVSSFKIEPDGNLTFLSQQPTEGGDPCHLVTDRSGRFLFVANHEHGTIGVLPIGPDGKLSPASDVRRHEGSGPGPTQQGPHAHFVALDPAGRLLCCDKGIDKVMIYRLDAAKGGLVPNDPPYGQLHAGAAPRHLGFHPSGKYCYVNGEADMTITAFAYDAERGAMTELHHTSTLPPGTTGQRLSTAQLVVHPSGRFVYVSNRGHHSIAVFAIDQATGRVSQVQVESTRGQTPRNFNVDPAGRFLYAANQDSSNIVTFRIDQQSGQLEPTGQVTEVGTPVCVIFGPT